MARKKPLILLIDDNQDFLEIFGIKLELAGFEVVKAQGGKEGVEQARITSPNFILLDLEMPGENGLEVLFKIRQELGAKKPKVFFLTNYGEPQKQYADIDGKYAEDVGADGYLRKSDDLDEIVERVKNILAA